MPNEKENNKDKNKEKDKEKEVVVEIKVESESIAVEVEPKEVKPIIIPQEIEVKKTTYLPVYKGREYYFGRKYPYQHFIVLDKSLKQTHVKRKMETVETLEEALNLSTDSMKSKTQKAYNHFIAASKNKKCSTC
jgi:YHS domain-containing protein